MVIEKNVEEIFFIIRQEVALMKIVKYIYSKISYVLKKILIGAVKFYRKFISPYKGNTHCRFTPTCSEYSLEALEKYGPFKGTYLSVKRILRCHPYSKHSGYDPVP